MRFELRNSGREHVSKEWATVPGIIVVHSRETQEGPGTGNRPLVREWSDSWEPGTEGRINPLQDASPGFEWTGQRFDLV